jgi:hypothetical protein
MIKVGPRGTAGTSRRMHARNIRLYFNDLWFPLAQILIHKTGHAVSTDMSYCCSLSYN